MLIHDNPYVGIGLFSIPTLVTLYSKSKHIKFVSASLTIGYLMYSSYKTLERDRYHKF